MYFDRFTFPSIGQMKSRFGLTWTTQMSYDFMER